jgi:lysyl-tRNA synthetase class 2
MGYPCSKKRSGIFMEKDKLRWDALRMQRLRQRHLAISAIREDFEAQGFLEVETPLLVKGTCPDLHIDTVAAGDGYLVTSTEYQIKRLMVGGFKKVFTLTKNFRAKDRGRYHSTEFTMLEWARAFEPLEVIEEDAIRFIRKAFQKLHPQQTSLPFNGAEINFMADWERLTVREALKKHLGLDNLGDFSLKNLLSASQKAQIALPETFLDDKIATISFLLSLLESHLGRNTPTFLQEWPAYLSTSAPLKPNDPSVAERNELYIGGIEISNGFPFLTDVDLQRKLFAQAQRQEHNKPMVTLDERFLDALAEGHPHGAGMALGIDRLIMVLTSSSQLADVQAFDWDEL